MSLARLFTTFRIGLQLVSCWERLLIVEKRVSVFCRFVSLKRVRVQTLSREEGLGLISILKRGLRNKCSWFHWKLRLEVCLLLVITLSEISLILELAIIRSVLWCCIELWGIFRAVNTCLFLDGPLLLLCHLVLSRVCLHILVVLSVLVPIEILIWSSILLLIIIVVSLLVVWRIPRFIILLLLLKVPILVVPLVLPSFLLPIAIFLTKLVASVVVLILGTILIPFSRFAIFIVESPITLVIFVSSWMLLTTPPIFFLTRQSSSLVVLTLTSGALIMLIRSIILPPTLVGVFPIDSFTCFIDSSLVRSVIGLILVHLMVIIVRCLFISTLWLLMGLFCLLLQLLVFFFLLLLELLTLLLVHLLFHLLV